MSVHKQQLIKNIHIVLLIALVVSIFYLSSNLLSYQKIYKNIADNNDLIMHIKVDYEMQKEELYDLQKSHFTILNQNLDHEYIGTINGLEVAFKIEESLPEHVYVVVDTFRQRMGLLYMDNEIIIPSTQYKYYVSTASDNELTPMDSGFITLDSLNHWYLYNVDSVVEDGFRKDTGIMDILEWIEYENPYSINLTYKMWDVYLTNGELS